MVCSSTPSRLNSATKPPVPGVGARRPVELGVGDEDVAVDVLDVEGAEVSGDGLRPAKAPLSTCWKLPLKTSTVPLPQSAA